PGWCSLQKTLALQREIGVGYEPQCVQDGQLFSPLQCDLSYCWNCQQLAPSAAQDKPQSAT
ncbi:hypothetical protein M9458_032114, partial [Cirrhinus mrigala]